MWMVGIDSGGALLAACGIHLLLVLTFAHGQAPLQG
jgi:hypothetical protein